MGFHLFCGTSLHVLMPLWRYLLLASLIATHFCEDNVADRPQKGIWG